MEQLICGDAREEAKKLPPDSVDCVIAAPPYWTTGPKGYDGDLGNESSVREYVFSLASIFEAHRKPLKEEGDLWVACADLTEDGYLQPVPWELVREMTENGWHLVDAVVWTLPTNTHEYLLRFANVPKRKVRHSVWNPPAPSDGYAHVTYCRDLDPGEWVSLAWWLVEPMLRLSTRKGDVVLNPFCGNGTVGLECQRHGRGYIGVDLDPVYVERAQRRLDERRSLVR
jgi:site-specific DNA-methyltransferase (adenine-specific)